MDMDQSKRSQGNILPMMEPPRYLKLGIDVEAIMRRNKVTMFAETSKCELTKIDKRRRPTIQLPKLFSLSKTAIPFMHARKLHKSLNLSTISLYHQMDRDIRSVSKEDFTQSHQSIISHLPSTTSLLRLGVPYTIERSRRKSRAIISQRQIQRIVSGSKLKKSKRQLGRKDMFVCPEYDPEKKQKVREEILELIAAKKKKDKGIKDGVVKLPDDEAEEEEEEEEEEEKGSPLNVNDEKVLTGYEKYLERQAKSRGESPDKEKSPSIKTQCKDNDDLKKSSLNDDLSVREMKNINRAFGLGSPIHRLVSLAAKEDAEDKNHSKPSVDRIGFSKFLEENVARKNRRAKRKRSRRYNPSTISLYHYILQDLQGESDNEFRTVIGSISELSFSDIPRVNSSLGLINKLSLMSSASLMSMDWKWLLPGEEPEKPKERPPPKKSESVRLVPTTMFDMCRAKKAVSHECTKMIREGTCGGENEGDYGQQTTRQGEHKASKHSWSPPPSSKFTAELKKWTKERGLKSLLCEIMGALRKSKTTNEARFIAEFLDSKLDQKALRERLSQNDEGNYDYTSAEKEIYSAADSEEATWMIYESLKKYFCRKAKEDGSQTDINADTDDRSICSSETSRKDDDNDEDICDACFLPSDPVMLSAYEGRTPYEIYRKQKKKKIKCSWPPAELCLPTGEIDLGEREVDPNNDIALLSRLLEMKGLTLRTVCDKKEDGGGEEEEGHLEEENALRKILEVPFCMQCEWWEKIVDEGKHRYDKYMERKDSRAWVCNHHNKKRYSLLPYKEPPREMSEDMRKAIQWVQDLCIRKREASELFDCRMRRENYKSLAMTLLKEKRKGLDIPQPPSALIPDKPSDFPEEGYRKLLEQERLLKEKLRQGKQKFSDTLKKLDMKMEEIICPKDCASWPEDLTAPGEDLLLAEKKAEAKDELIQNYIKLVKEFRLWNMSELILTRFINTILHKIYPRQQLVNNYTSFNLSRGVDFFNSLILVEAVTNESLYDFIDTFEEFEYVRILTRICQECPRLPSMHGWAPETVMFNLTEYGIDKLPTVPTDPTLPPAEEIKASNWQDFFTLTKRTTYPSDYGKYKPYLHNLEDPDEPSEQDESLKPLKSNKLKDLWQDLPATVSFLDFPGGKIEPRPSDRIVRNSGKSSGSQKVPKLEAEDDPLKIKKIEEVKEFISDHPPKALDFNNLFRQDDHAEQRKSILVILAEVIETEAETLSRINSMIPNDNDGNDNDDDDDNDENRDRKKKKKKIFSKVPSTGITVVPASQDKEEERRMSKFHDGMEKMFRSLNNSRYHHLDGMEERLEVMDAPEQRDVVRSRPSVILEEPPKLAKRLLSVVPHKIPTLEDLKATDIETLEDEEEAKEEEQKEDESKTGKVFEKNVPTALDKDYFATSDSAMARKIFLKLNPLKTKVSSKLSHDATNVDSKVRILPSRHSQLGLSNDNRFSQSEIAKLAAGKDKAQDKDKGKRKVTILDKEQEEEDKTT